MCNSNAYTVKAAEAANGEPAIEAFYVKDPLNENALHSYVFSFWDGRKAICQGFVVTEVSYN